MAFSDKRLRSIKCDGPGCDKAVEFDLADIKAIQAIDWLKGVRVIQTGDNRNFSYCSDVCEVKGVTTGQHNLKEQPQIQIAASPAEIKALAEQAQAAAVAEEALKTGNGEARVSLE
ncbi:MAG: hypothetical protein ACREQ5_07370 [Candidatus Dormibacteria bacterium]